MTTSDRELIPRKLKRRAKKFGSRFAFEFFVEVMHDQIVKALQKYLSSIQPEDIRSMVRKGRFPPLEKLDFTALGDNIEHLEKISLVRLMEFIAEARPDLATAIQDMGMPGARYIAKLRLHLLDQIKHPEKELAKSIEYKAKEEMALATCDKCGKSWPVPKDKAASIKECPFCHAGKEEGIAQPDES